MKPSTTVGRSLGRWGRAVLIVMFAVIGLRATSGQEPAPGQSPSPDRSASAPPPANTLSADSPTKGTPPGRREGPPGGVDGLGGGMGGPGGGPGYSATWYPSRPVLGGGFGGLPGSVGFVRQSVTAGAPLWVSPPDTLILTTNVRHTLFQTDTLLPDTGRPFPDQLWSVNFGLLHMRKLENGWSAGGMFGFGSSSDRPFHSVREMNLSVLAFLNVPAFGGRDSWRFSVFYTPVGPLNFPIPGVAYLWKPNERLSVSLGLPFSVDWRPTDDWTVTASYIPLTNVSARITRRLTGEWRAYAGYEWLNESYFLTDRAVAADRFIGLEQRLIGGLTYTPGERLTLDLNAGYAFSRSYGEGENLFGPLRDRVDILGGAFLGGALRLRF